MGFMGKRETPATDLKFRGSPCALVVIYDASSPKKSPPRLDELYEAEDAALRAWEECSHGWETRCKHRIAFDDAWRAVGVALATAGRPERGVPS
jgi:hypothetical protein